MRWSINVAHHIIHRKTDWPNQPKDPVEHSPKSRQRESNGLGHKATERALGIPNNLQDYHTHNPVPFSIRSGSGHADGVPDSEFKNPSEGMPE